METRQTYIESMPTPLEWQEELEALVPRKEGLSYLKIVWEPGEPWDPAQRWMVYQMLPLGSNPADHLLGPMLEGPNPREFGHYDRVKKRFVRRRGAPMISLRQWLLYRETGMLAQPYWVIQGDRGGHRWDFTKTEKLIIARKTGQKDVEPPTIGDLPYAEVDNRVFDKLTNLDRLRKDEFAVAFAYRHPELFEAEEERILLRAENDVWRWLESQVDDRLRDLPYGWVSRMAGFEAAPRIYVP